MKTSVIKTVIASGLLLAGMNVMTSCNGCSDKKETDTTTESTVTDVDTLSTTDSDTLNGYNNETGTNATMGRATNPNTTGTAGSGNRQGGSSNTTGNATGSGNNSSSAPAIDPNNDPIENSNYNKNKKSGNIDGGGTGGTGGTGTGTTGNNSRVSDPKDQRN